MENVIRTGFDGFEINFGPLVVAELDGIKFAMEDWRAKQLEFVILEEEVPTFFTGIKLTMQYAVAQVSAYVFDKADLKPLGLRLSTVDTMGMAPERVDVYHRARILMMWKQGAVFSEQVSIDHFYDGMSEEEIEYSRF